MNHKFFCFLFLLSRLPIRALCCVARLHLSAFLAALSIEATAILGLIGIARLGLAPGKAFDLRNTHWVRHAWGLRY